jgi:hypothetical protein
VTPVRTELTVASGRVSCIHEDVISFAKDFITSANSLITEGEKVPNATQRWLALSRHLVNGFVAGIVFNPHIGCRPVSGIDFEMNRTVALRAVKNPHQYRVRCVPSDRSVWLDGKRVANGLDEDVFAYVEVLAAGYPVHIPFKGIQNQKPTVLLGVNQSRLKEKLPRELKKLVTRGQRGHVLRLPD